MRTALHKIAKGLMAGTLGLVAVSAQAAPGNTKTVSGTANVTIAQPAQIQKVDDLRFGVIVRPAGAGMVEIDPSGTITANIDISAYPGNRGPSRFLLVGDNNRRFLVFLPSRIDITNGTATMRVDRFRMNAVNGSTRFDANGRYNLYVGGRLNVGANQAVGQYSGTFDVTVVYQ
ncbi:DUF4402 domain-containing protein [Qipengyuania soli]|uniref:DUF4402 domain-containing protein n=1 Tax=Qipengyuania soli TaxID=2782568 RepID=A0A7S8F4A7_9SPHN|nr:DUF4402 domain-containing protein [Qipengyuania soli]QPC98906.1 DUF4402 domain-containing protein [Qipengyuania soli]